MGFEYKYFKSKEVPKDAYFLLVLEKYYQWANFCCFIYILFFKEIMK